MSVEVRMNTLIPAAKKHLLASYKFVIMIFIFHLHLQSPIHYSNVALVDPVTKAAVRVARRYLEDGEKVPLTSPGRE